MLSKQKIKISKKSAAEAAARRLSRAEKKKAKKANPAGSPSSSPSPSSPVVAVKREPKATLKQKRKLAKEVQVEKFTKEPNEAFIANLASKCRHWNKAEYLRLQSSQTDLEILAAEAVRGVFGPVIAKPKGYNQLRLMELVIIYFKSGKSQQHKETPKAQATQRKPRKPRTHRQQLQAAQARAATSQPVTNAATPIVKRRKPKAKPSRSEFDPTDAFDEQEFIPRQQSEPAKPKPERRESRTDLSWYSELKEKNLVRA